MVAGDLVNTASRIQSAAEPGTVLVGEATRRATEQTDRLRGRGQPRAEGQGRPVSALARAAGRLGRARVAEVAGLEAPFVGRDRELRQIKELFHACADEGKAHLVSITGIAGIGKSRLGVGVLQVLRRDRPDDVLAPRPLSRLRRGRHLLGARGHGADARADRRGRGRRGSALAKLAAVVEEHIDGRGRAALRRAAARASARARRERRVRAGGSLRRVAAVLRAAGRSSTRW